MPQALPLLSPGLMRALTFLSLAAACAPDDREPAPALPLGSAHAAIVNGALVEDFPAVGLLMKGPTIEESHMWCTGTLIGCTTYVTAAQCVCDGPAAACPDAPPAEPMWIYFQHAGFVPVATIAVDPTYDDQSFEHDVAVLTLAEPVSGIAPTLLSAAAHASGSPVELVGFGRVGPGSDEYGMKRHAQAAFADCPVAWGVERLCFSDPEATTCAGDSGAGYLVRGPSGFELAGVHSSGYCEAGKLGVGSTIGGHRAFLEAKATGSLGEPACDALAPVGDPSTVVTGEHGRIEAGAIVERTIDVAPGTAELRVAMNSTDTFDSAANDVDLELWPPDVDAPACQAIGSSPVGVCRVAAPIPGAWRIRVSAKAGPSDFQLVATTFAGGPIAAEDRFETAAGAALTVAAPDGVLANDDGPLGALAATLVSEPSHGTVELAEDGGFVYTPAADHVGPDAFTYQASDGIYTASAVVTVETLAGPTSDPAPTTPSDITAGCAAGAGPPGWAAVLLAWLAWRRRRR